MTSYLIIVNPASGSGAGLTRAAALRRALSERAEVHVEETDRRGAATELASTWLDRVDRIVAVGGDGTLNEVLHGLVRADRPAAELPALAFLPAGTANAATLGFGFNSDPEEVARTLPEAEVRAVDVGSAEWDGGRRPFLLWFGAGFDAVVIDALNSSRTGRMGLVGLVRNAPRVLGALGRYPAPRLRVEVDDTPPTEAASVVLANVADMAFGASVIRTADPFDGELDVVSIEPGSKLRLPGLGLGMLLSSLGEVKGTRHVRATRVRLSSEGTVPFQLDGEPVGHLPVSVRLCPGAVRLILTGGNHTSYLKV